MNVNPLIQKIRKELKSSADPKYKKNSQIFFKEKIKTYGVRTPIVRSIAKRYFKEIKDLKKQDIFNISEELLKTDSSEEATIAVQWVSEIQNQFEKKDFQIFEKWVNQYINNWSKVDDFCLSIMSHFLVKFPEFVPKVKSWTKSKNLWVRRASAVSFIKGKSWKIHEQYLKDVFDVANILLKDEEDLVRKGYGWMLKVASQTHQKEVFNFVMKNKSKMPRVSLRYAIEKMPKNLKEKAMKR